jgi:hypothetical protein
MAGAGVNSDVGAELKLAAIAVAGSCALIAVVSVPLHQPLRLGMTWLLLTLGPIGGWIGVASYPHAMPGALQLLIPATLPCAVPAGIYALRRGAEWLGVTFLAWLACGYLFTIAIWI